MAVPGQHLLGMGKPVDLDTLEQDLAQSQHDRTVRILGGLRMRVVLAVNRGPPLRAHPGGEPEPETEDVGEPGVQIDGAMRRVTVQVDGDGDDGRVTEEEGGDRLLPDVETENSVKPKNRIQHGFTTLSIV